MERSFGLLAFKSIVDCHLLSTDVLLLQLFVLTPHFNDFSIIVLCLWWKCTLNYVKEAIQT